MKRILLSLLFLLIPAFLPAKVYTPASVPNVKLKHDSCYVSNPDTILNEDDANYLNRLCRTLEDSTQVQMCIVAIESMGDNDIFNFSHELYQRWGIGKKGKNTGVLVVFVLSSHDIRIHTGTGIEGVLTDACCKSIIEKDMVPLFKKDDYGGGIVMGATRIYEKCTKGGAPKELLAMKSVTNRGGFEKAGSGSGENGDDDGIPTEGFLYIAILSCLVAFPIAVVKLSRNHRKNDAADEYEENRGCFLGCLVCTLFWPFVLPVFLYVWAQAHTVKCPKCGKRKFKRTTSKTVQEPTYKKEGLRENGYDCQACGYHMDKQIVISKKTESSGGGGDYSGGGYSSGGSSYSSGSSSSGGWGGGSSSGGGASGKW